MKKANFPSPRRTALALLIALAVVLGACSDPTASLEYREMSLDTGGVSLSGAGTSIELLQNGDFSSGLTGWSLWRERSHLSAAVVGGRAELSGTDINGGIYQQFATGGAGTRVDISGIWETVSTTPNSQWAEVLIINGTRTPQDGSDVNANQSDVELIFKNDTWTSPSGWSGSFAVTSPVASTGYFTAAGDTATIILKTGNLQTASSVLAFDSISAVSTGTAISDPVAAAVASPTGGDAPLTVQLDGSGSTCDPAESLSYSWQSGDGSSYSSAVVNHTYTAAGTYQAVLTVTDGRGVSDSETVSISVGTPPDPDNLIVNGNFGSGSNDWTLWTERGSVNLQTTVDDRLALSGNNFNGGVYQQFATGGAGNIIDIEGFWASSPTIASAQWAEVLIINGSRLPQNSQPVDATQNDVVMIYKNDTWTTPSGWSGTMSATAPVVATGSFTAAGATATIVLKCGNIEGAGTSGTLWDDIDVRVSGYEDPDPDPTPGGKSKLSVHSGGGTLTDQFVREAQPTTLKLLDNFGYASVVKQVSPDTVVIGRIYLPVQPMTGDPQTRAAEWWSANSATILQYPDIDYWEGYNETSTATVAEIAWYAEFEAERTRILAANGRKSCIGNFSLGTPDVTDPNAWPAFYPAIDAALANGGILGLHEYGTPMQQYYDFGDEEGWLCGRYRKAYNQYLIPSGREIPLVITETGVDNEAPVGWVNWFTEAEYLSQLEWYDSIMMENDYVLGAQIFALEIPGWGDFDIAPIMPELTVYVRDSVQ